MCPCMSKISSCGKHKALSDNPGARVTQCACGTVHVLVKQSGVSVQLSEERFQQLGLAVMGAVSALGSKTAATPTSPPRIIN
jgi:hypothetical protein